MSPKYIIVLACNDTRVDCWADPNHTPVLRVKALYYRSISQRFPLQDKSRLQKWVSNMKREQWTPSRHQYLCSEHFTADCFDIRWGIRYLKNTAIPTIFPSSEDVCILQHLENIKLRIQF